MYVDALKVRDNEKAEFKQKQLEQYEKMNEILRSEDAKKREQIINEAKEIIIDRRAKEIESKNKTELNQHENMIVEASL